MIARIPQEDLGVVLKHPRYTLTGRVLGQGTWGTIYEAEDNSLGERVAVKVLTPTAQARKQMKERQLTPFEAMKNEGGLAACAHIVPRAFEIDSEGVPFIAMPVYDSFLNDRLRDQSLKIEHRNKIGNGLEVREAYQWLEDIATGLEEMHDVRRRAHADLKPDNIAVDRRSRALISDLGTSTCASLDWAEAPRDNMGFVYTRAPECFDTEGHPDKRSDVWSFGALAYRMITGEYPLEGEAMAPGEIVKDKKKFAEVIQRKMKKIPKEHTRLAKVIERSLAYNSWDRYYGGQSLSEAVHQAVHPSTGREIARALNRVGKPTAYAAMGALAVAGVSFIGGSIAHVGNSDNRPLQTHGLLYLGSNNDTAFESEILGELPSVPDGALFMGVDRLAKTSTANRDVATLVASYAKAQLEGRVFCEIITPYQKDVFEQVGTARDKSLSLDSYVIPARAIEKNLSSLRTPEGKVDLEDLCIASRLGPETLNEAKKLAGSDKYANYITAKRSDGSFVIPDKEQRFSKVWLSYIHTY